MDSGSIVHMINENHFKTRSFNIRAKKKRGKQHEQAFIEWQPISAVMRVLIIWMGRKRPSSVQSLKWDYHVSQWLYYLASVFPHCCNDFIPAANHHTSERFCISHSLTSEIWTKKTRFEGMRKLERFESDQKQNRFA